MITKILNDYNELYKYKKKLEKEGYSFDGYIEGVFKFSGKEEYILKPAFNIEHHDIVSPDYTRSMINLTSSISSYYGKELPYPRLKELDEYLTKDIKHIFFLIVDGLGSNNLKIIGENKFLRKNLKNTIIASYPSTTACAIPISTSAKLPLETAWIGWENYFEEYKLHLIMFTGNNYITDSVTGINIRKSILPYDDYFKSFNVYTSDLEPSFKPSGFDKLSSLLKEELKIMNSKDKTFTYAYWDEPDSTMHEFGANSKEALECIDGINKDIEEFSKKMPNDSIMIITADHGHQNVNAIKLYEFDDLYSMLKRYPSNDGRCLAFKVKEEYYNEFEVLFNKYFSNIYKLIKSDDFIKEGYLGDSSKYIAHPRLKSFLGDYVGMAISNYYFDYIKRDNKHIHKSTHAGLTENEMEVPLIIFKK